MSLSNEHVGSYILAKINTSMLTRAELLIHLCYEIPCMPILIFGPVANFGQQSIVEFACNIFIGETEDFVAKSD